MPPLSEADHQVRATGIGSSDISAIVGENPWSNAHDVWQRKLNLVPPFPETNATRLGHDMEPIIGRWYTRDTGRILRKGGGTKRHKDRSWQLCTIDFGFAKGERRIVECKHVGHYASAGWTMEADGAPPYVQIQAQWQMGVLGYERADVAVIFGGNADFRIYEYSFDATMFGHLTELGRRFWENHVLAGKMPEIDHSDAARDSLRAVYGFNRAPLKDAPPEASEWIAKRIEADATIKSAEKAKALATNKLCEFIGDADGIRTETHYATWKQTAAGTRSFRLAEFKKDRRAA